MIAGIGTDLVAIARFRPMVERWGHGCGRRFLATTEQAAFMQAADPARFLAKRFAAKEALAKALGTGVRAPVLLTAIAVEHDALGKPVFRFAEPLGAWMRARGIGCAHLSISDEQHHALAFVVLEAGTPDSEERTYA